MRNLFKKGTSAVIALSMAASMAVIVPTIASAEDPITTTGTVSVGGHTVTINVLPESSASVTYSVNEDQLTLNSTPASGYTKLMNRVTSGSALFNSTDGYYTITDDVTIEVLNGYQVTWIENNVDDASMGVSAVEIDYNTAIRSGRTAVVYPGSWVKLIATPIEGYSFVGWYRNGSLVKRSAENYISNVSKDMKGYKAIYMPTTNKNESTFTGDEEYADTEASVLSSQLNLTDKFTINTITWDITSSTVDGSATATYTNEGNILGEAIFYIVVDGVTASDLEAKISFN